MANSYPEARTNLLYGLDSIVIGAYYDTSVHTMEIIRACITSYSSTIDVDIVRRINQLIYTWNVRCIPGTGFPYLYPNERLIPEDYPEIFRQQLFESYYRYYLMGFYLNRQSISQRLFVNVGICGAFDIDKTTMLSPSMNQSSHVGINIVDPSIHLENKLAVADEEKVPIKPILTQRARKNKKNVVFESN